MDQLEKSKVLSDYKSSLLGKTKEELEQVEKEIIKEADEIDAKVSKTEFKLDSKGYKEAATAIQYFLNKQTVQWQYSLGMATMYETWNPEKNPKKIAYAVLDSTLRTVGGMQFTGYDEWTKVVLINKYFESIRDEYSTLTSSIYEIADKHSVVMDLLQAYAPETNAINEVAEGLETEEPNLPMVASAE